MIRCQVSRPFIEALWENKSFPSEYCVLSAVSSISVENFEQNMTKSKSKSKKSDKGKEGNNLSNTSDSRPPSSCDIRPPTPAIQSPVNSSSRLSKPWFQSEILNMMYAFGDSRKPATESATLIEEIVHSQMASLVVRAAEVTTMRGGRFMSVEDIIFLMRKDKEKLKRLIKYLNFKDLKSKSQKQTSQDDDEVLEASVGEIKGNKRRKVCYDFISSIDQTGDLVALFDDDDVDEIKQERNERAERLSRTLDPQQYMEFTECRQANFNKKAGKFKEWLDCTSLIDMKPNTPVMDVFSFLAYETVGQIVDLALLVKKDLEGGDVMMQVMPPVSILSESQSSVVTPASTTSTPSTPNHTPPDTPTTPTTPFLPSPTTSATSSTSTTVQNSSLASKPKSKKRKVKGSAASLLYSSGDCIQPEHIHEAIRRYNHFIGPMAPFSAHVKPPQGYRTLCC